MQENKENKIKIELQEEQLFEAQKRREQEQAAASDFVNSLGMRMLSVGADTFKMGGGDIDINPLALPRHEVVLTKDYYIAQEPVTTEQFARYEKEVFGAAGNHQTYRGYLLGIRYDEAAAFAAWLTDQEGRTYHLPTEAEWEYAARQADKVDTDRMCDRRIREWCYDYYAPYTDLSVTDPAGPLDGRYRCVRGGYMDNPKRLNEYPLDVYFRAALPPDYAHDADDTNNDFGIHPVGFRLVCGEMPHPSGYQAKPGYNFGVRQKTESYVGRQAIPDRPYFRKRYLFPVPPDNCTQEEIRAAGFSAYFRHHHHSPGFAVTANGDLVYDAYSTYHEYDAESGLVGARFRMGEDQWEMPDVFEVPIGINDHGPMLDTAPDGTVRHFWGWPQLDHAYPFQYTESADNAEHFGPVRFPKFTNKAEYVVPQPVNTCVHGGDGTFYMVSDSTYGSSSVLWRSKDNCQTWENPKGRTAGRHTTAVELRDGSIAAYGGKNSEIDGYMPVAVTRDGGDSYTVSKTGFPALSSGQRPCITRLLSGRLVFCADYQNKKGQKPEAFKDVSGSYVAFSDDDGATWKMKTLWGTQQRKKSPENYGGATTLGYSTLRQGRDGLIHLVCTNVHPLLHLTFNEAWLDDTQMEEPSEQELMRSTATKLTGEQKEYREYYEDGSLRCIYHGGIADDGRFLLDGGEKFWYPDGGPMREGNYHLGKRCGTMVYFDRDGNPVRRFTYPDHPGEDMEEWFETFWPESDQVRTRTFYRNRKAVGEAVCFDRNGKETNRVAFMGEKTPEDLQKLRK